MDRLDEHGVGAEPYVGEGAQGDVFFFCFGAGDENFVNVGNGVEIKSLIDLCFVIAVFHFGEISGGGADAEFFIERCQRPRVLLCVHGREHGKAVRKRKPFMVEEAAVQGDRVPAIGNSGGDA